MANTLVLSQFLTDTTSATAKHSLRRYGKKRKSHQPAQQYSRHKGRWCHHETIATYPAIVYRKPHPLLAVSVFEMPATTLASAKPSPRQARSCPGRIKAPQRTQGEPETMTATAMAITTGGVGRRLILVRYVYSCVALGGLIAEGSQTGTSHTSQAGTS